jgi:hypothetical protein
MSFFILLTNCFAAYYFNSKTLLKSGCYVRANLNLHWRKDDL